jgi:hypothetical protein
MSEELKPCSFCGEPGTQSLDDGGQFPQNLYGCCYCQMWATDPVTWNTRPIEEARRARITELETLTTGLYGLEEATHFRCCGCDEIFQKPAASFVFITENQTARFCRECSKDGEK